MSFLTKWGFSRQERIALTLLSVILALGLVLSYARRNSGGEGNVRLSAEDSSAIAKLAEAASAERNSFSEGQPHTAIVKQETNIFPLDINTASAEQLDLLPGIGPVLAQRIVEYRSQNGSFTAVDSLVKVAGIGKTKLSRIKDKIKVSVH